MSIKPIHAIAAAGLIFSSACSYHPIKDFNPAQPDGVWKEGVMYMESRSKEALVLLGYSNYSKDGYVFNAVIRNLSEHSISFRPETIVCDEYGKQNNLIRSQQAVDPEEKLAKLEKNIQVLEENSLGVALLDAAGSTIDIFTIPSTPEEREARDKRRREEEQRELRDQERIKALKAEKDDISDRLLRRHDLSEGETITGQIICPNVKSDTRLVRVKIPLGNNEHSVSWSTKERS